MPKNKNNRRIRFTKPALSALPTPEKGRVYYYDEKTSGLAICVTQAGSKAFYLYKKVQGKPMRLRLGTFPDVSIEQSRKLAAKALAEIADGNNPQEDRMIQREHARDEFTLRELFGWFIEHHAKPHKKQNSIKEDERLFERYLKPWDNHRISTIKCLDVRTLHAKIGRENGKYAANRMLSLLGTMFAKAIDSDDVALETANPTRGITRFDEKSRDRFLQSDELPKFFESLEQEPSGVMRDFFLILLLTGARRSNTLAMRWNDINLELAVWRIPETKSGDAVAIPLSLDAVQILESRKALAEKSCEWVFPATRSDSISGHLNYPAKAWKRICDRAGLVDLRIHDLRRTLGSWQAATGASLPVIGKTLGHRNQATTQIYARLNLDPVRQSVDTATAAMMALAQSKPEKIEQLPSVVE